MQSSYYRPLQPRMLGFSRTAHSRNYKGMPVTTHLFRQRVEDRLKNYNSELSAEESALLMVSVECGQPMRRGEFAEIMLRDKTTITRQLDRLEEKRLVRRKEDPTDGRASLIHPTSKGTRQIKKILPDAETLRRGLKRGLTAEEWAIGMKAMRQMKDNLIAMGSPD